MANAIARASAVFCHGDLLDAVQRLRLFPDSKHFVDMPMRMDPEDIIVAFEALPASSRADAAAMRAFVDQHFDEPGAELVPFTPGDWPTEPPLLPLVADPGLQQLLRALHELWPTLCRVLAPKVLEAPQRHSSLLRRSPVVLPGGRFRETYYWDSLWIVEGLLASGMPETARGLVQNLLDDVGTFGFVPNGGRVYYLNRSQPPLLCEMVASVGRALGPDASTWLAAAVSMLEKEHAWWMAGEHIVKVSGFALNRFAANWRAPRPESYGEDVETAGGDPAVYRELATAAETGWDFSSRWSWRGGQVGGTFVLRETQATRVVPIDLNAILYRAELTLAVLCEAVATNTSISDTEAAVASGKGFTSSSAVAFAAAAADRRTAIQNVMWQPALHRWIDAWMPEAGVSSSDAFSPTDRAPTLADFATPLWAGLADASQGAGVVAALRASRLLGEGGVSTTAVEGTGQQWDAPNAWPPLQSMLIQGLRRLDASSGGPALAAELAQRWVGTCFAAWRRTGYMYEKYDALHFGSGGGGGEYEPQVGFGWSNGAVLELLRDYGSELVSQTETAKAGACDKTEGCTS